MEHRSEWCAPYLDRMKNRPPAAGKPNQDAQGEYRAVCIPLWALVFRDSTVIRMQNMPWEQALCFGGHPTLRLPLASDFEASGALERLRIQTKLNERIGFDELVRHEWLDTDFTRERCEYSSGVAVEADLAAHTFKIEGHPEFDGKVTSVPGASADA